ncbi:hypothetical protein [uncultured Methanolobus sp.]|uniref:hypothetical protein n=1 Tax=uncultured Methanolobus sp. TaxID=218300 RepID=UPI002AAC303E|nr:hypothetical protein [uncultured Methanolobus sp.]
MSESFNEVWSRIIEHAGKEFKTKTGKPLTYIVKGNLIVPCRTKYNLSKSDFEEVYKRLPLSGPGEINDDVRGPAYIWAILHDERIVSAKK